MKKEKEKTIQEEPKPLEKVETASWGTNDNLLRKTICLSEPEKKKRELRESDQKK
ncbi:hypothetical protein [Methanoregula sp.]|uniref:hypothetical protein n=1 Tax=Methanoregula sp. TaxID=2052170 RepID=UPI0035664A82